MAVSWHEFYGGFLHLGNYNDVFLGGSPKDAISNLNLSLAEAHNKKYNGGQGYGKGIGFENNGYDVTVHLDLVSFSVKPDGKATIVSNCYVLNSGVYNWWFEIQTSNDNEASWSQPMFSETIFNHNWNVTHLYTKAGEVSSWNGGYVFDYDWTYSASLNQFSKKFTIPKDTTHVRFNMSGERVAEVGQISFPIEVLIPDFRPMAIRKNEKFLTLDRSSGFLKRRVNANWVDIPKMKLSEQGVSNVGTSRIRKNGTWKGQTKIGE